MKHILYIYAESFASDFKIKRGHAYFKCLKWAHRPGKIEVKCEIVDSTKLEINLLSFVFLY